ncbi:MAG: hypothetical protein MJZ95_06585 [Paludibacteraceae bacterium]|nr:hypothetical protein [Paludibacteraceae bacterium]
MKETAKVRKVFEKKAGKVLFITEKVSTFAVAKKGSLGEWLKPPVC